MKFFTIENSQGTFTINVDHISTIIRYKAQEYEMYRCPRSGEYYLQPETYVMEVGSHKFSIKENEYQDIRRLMLQEMEKENGN